MDAMTAREAFLNWVSPYLFVGIALLALTATLAVALALVVMVARRKRDV